MNAPKYLDLLDTRTVVFDGAMGTSIQSRDPSPEDFGGVHLEGCNDHLVLSAPELIKDIHASFLDVGCDVVETNTFRANRFALREYGIQDSVTDINLAAARLGRELADSFSTTERHRFVAGSVGPSGFLPSSSDPELGRITYEELVEGYEEQAEGLLSGGVDLILIETGQDILEVRASITGARRAVARVGRRVPVQVQITLDPTGRMLLGTDIASAMVTLEALRVDVLGINCSTGPEHMRNPVRYLFQHGRTPISVIPNAGIPSNVGGEAVYPLSPEELAHAHREFVEEFGVAVVGGCCGTTPAHLKAVVEGLEGVARRPRPSSSPVPRVSSGVRAVDLRQIPAPTIIGERVNAQGSRRVKDLLLADDLEGVLQVAREQVEGGAHVLDVCVALTENGDEASRMRGLVKLLSQGVEAPLMVDTTEVDVAISALRQIPGRAVLNSIHLEGGRSKLDQLLPHVLEHGAALVALTIDETGMARTSDQKVEVARRLQDICVGEYCLDPSDLIFDVLTFTLATGEEEYRRSAVETLEAIRRIRSELPGTLTSLGVSNVSFGLQPHARAIVNSVFLHHCVEAGLDLAILNPAHIKPFHEIDEDARTLAEDLILDRTPDALASLIQFFEGRSAEPTATEDPRLSMTPSEAAHWMILHRKGDGIEESVEEVIEGLGGGHKAAVTALNEVLLPAMKEVGDLFGAGDLILPFVLQSAEVMKRAVKHLEGFLEKAGNQSKGTIVLATVQGDVHDIGKNLVHTILENNGYTVHNLGKQVPVDTILKEAQELEADAIGLSALLVSTSKQMPLCVQELNRRGLEIPVLLGGAAINPSFVGGAAEIGDAPNPGEPLLYPHGVFYCKDAFAGLSTMDSLMDSENRPDFLESWAKKVRDRSEQRKVLAARAAETAPTSVRSAPSRENDIPEPPFWGPRVLESIPLSELFSLIDRNTLFRLHWGAKNAKGERYEQLLREEFEPRFARFQEEALKDDWLRVSAAYGFYPAGSAGNDLLLFHPENPRKEIGRFPFPRQNSREELCLSDFFHPLVHTSTQSSEARGNNSGLPRDTSALQIVTVQSPRLVEAVERIPEGDYSEAYFLHGFGVRLAEAAAEFVHRQIRKELGIDADQGLRYSWGYGACPDPLQHRTAFQLLPAEARLGMTLTDAGSLVPELSTAALVVHHPEARYFSV